MKFGATFVCFLLLTLTFATAEDEEGQTTTTTTPLTPPVSDQHDDDLDSLVQAMPKNLDNVDYGPEVSYLLQKVSELSTRFQSLEQHKQDRLEDFLKSPVARETATNQAGSTYVRWGRKSCPYNSVLVYEGVVGGKLYNDKGSGANHLCLTSTPQFDYTPKPVHNTYLYGTEYEHIGNLHNHDVPCSVCLAPHPITIMVPGTLTCPPGWTPQYNGHLISAHASNYATEFVCLDNEPESSTSGYRNDDGNTIYFVLGVCGSLPCPPYAENKVVTCVVCSK